MRKSYYNFLFPKNNGKTVLYNARTGAMAELDKEHSELLRKCSEEEIEQINPEFAEALLVNGFATENEVSELDMIKYDSLRARFGNHTLNLTIAPTQDCNFCCAYCFEKENMKATYMDDDTKDSLIKYVQQNAIPEGKLEICWYGGEPLLAINKIEEMTDSFLEICDEKRIKYDASIITNGYLLSTDIVQKLIKCKVSVIQITLDGDRETHDCRRALKGGCETYDVIWRNLLALKKYAKQLFVHLRVNVDKENSGSLEAVRTKIEQESMTEFVLVYPGKVVNSGNCYKKDACYNNQEFARTLDNTCVLSRFELYLILY